MSAKFFKMVGLTPIPTRPPQVKVANGQVLISDHWIPKMSLWCNGVTMQADMKVLELDTFDAILGYDWLQLSIKMCLLILKSCHPLEPMTTLYHFYLGLFQ